jgi:hypothetical protein
MTRRFFGALLIGLVLALAGCGDGHNPPPTVTTSILSDPVYDGDIANDNAGTITITQGMSPTVQSVFAGIDPVTLTEYRAFLDFPLSGQGGVPLNAVIVSAFLNIVIDSIQPPGGTVPIRIELVTFQPPNLIATDYDRGIQPPLAFTTIIPPIGPADVGNNVSIDVTNLMVEAQRLGLPDFQVRILENLGPVIPGLIEIDDTTGANRSALAPLLDVTYF